MKNILLNLSVKGSASTADLNAAIDETYELAKKQNIGFLLNYVNLYNFTITPDMSSDEIQKLKDTRIFVEIVIGM